MAATRRSGGSPTRSTGTSVLQLTSADISYFYCSATYPPGTPTDGHHDRSEAHSEVERAARDGDAHRQCHRPSDRASAPLGHDRPQGDGHPKTLRRPRRLHLRSRLHRDGKLRIEDHLYRRRRGRAALSRLPDRGAGRAQRLHGGGLSPPLRRAADRRREDQIHARHHAPHHGARADRAVLQRIPARCASDGGDVRRGRRAVGLLSRFDRHLRPAPAHGRVVPAHRQDADHRRHGVQILDRPALSVSEERSWPLPTISCT